MWKKNQEPNPSDTLVPRPVQLGSLRSEHKTQDFGVRLVPAGGRGWGKAVREEEEREEKERAEKEAKEREERERAKAIARAKMAAPVASSNEKKSWAELAATSPSARMTKLGGLTNLGPISLSPKPMTKAGLTIGSPTSATSTPSGNPGSNRWADMDADDDFPWPSKNDERSPFAATRIETATRIDPNDDERSLHGFAGARDFPKPGEDTPKGKTIAERAAERKAEEEERVREQHERAQKKLRELEARAAEREKREAEEKRREAEERERKAQELRDPNRPSVWDDPRRLGKFGTPPEARREPFERAPERPDVPQSRPPPSPVMTVTKVIQNSAPRSPEHGPRSPKPPPERALPPPPLEQAPPPPKVIMSPSNILMRPPPSERAPAPPKPGPSDEPQGQSPKDDTRFNNMVLLKRDPNDDHKKKAEEKQTREEEEEEMKQKAREAAARQQGRERAEAEARRKAEEARRREEQEAEARRQAEEEEARRKEEEEARRVEEEEEEARRKEEEREAAEPKRATISLSKMKEKVATERQAKQKEEEESRARVENVFARHRDDEEHAHPTEDTDAEAHARQGIVAPVPSTHPSNGNANLKQINADSEGSEPLFVSAKEFSNVWQKVGSTPTSTPPLPNDSLSDEQQVYQPANFELSTYYQHPAYKSGPPPPYKPPRLSELKRLMRRKQQDKENHNDGNKNEHDRHGNWKNSEDNNSWHSNNWHSTNWRSSEYEWGNRSTNSARGWNDSAHGWDENYYEDKHYQEKYSENVSKKGRQVRGGAEQEHPKSDTKNRGKGKNKDQQHQGKKANGKKNTSGAKGDDLDDSESEDEPKGKGKGKPLPQPRSERVKNATKNSEAKGASKGVSEARSDGKGKGGKNGSAVRDVSSSSCEISSEWSSEGEDDGRPRRNGRARGRRGQGGQSRIKRYLS